ncbi:MAG: cytidine deaminase [Candidatus Heimdallarchaeaceae archaeon]
MSKKKETIPNLIKFAKKASEKAYAPYSNFKVGAAIQTRKGTVFTGCNVEFSDYLALHAELNAIGTAIAAGDSHIELVVVYSSSSPPTLPCGSCRQKIFEFSKLHGSEIQIIAVNNKNERIEKKITELLPGGEIFLSKNS